MNLVHPPTADLHEHYRQLRSTHPWLDVSMCWTVVVPDDGQALPLNQLAARLGGDVRCPPIGAGPPPCSWRATTSDRPP